jgi:hypothetical protein
VTPGLYERATASPRLVIAGLGALFLGAYVASLIFLPKADGRIVVGDAVHHFVQLRSAVYDGDLDFANDYAALYGFDLNSAEGRAWVEPRLTPTGRVRNFMPVGPAVVWAPLYGLGGAVIALMPDAAATGPRGTERLMQAMPGVSGILAVTLAAWLAWRLASSLTDRRSALAGVVGVWLGTHAIYYSLISPAYSHAASMLATTMVVWHWQRARPRWSVGAAAISGALVGIAALMRWQDAVLLLIPAIESVRSTGSLAGRAGRLAAAGAAAAVAFTPQMIVWQSLYGQPFAIPQGAAFMEWTGPNLVAVLFSDNHGLFSWSPMLLLAAAGLVTLARRERWLVLPTIAVVAASWYVNAAVSDWWAGEAYGARRFLSLFPFFVIGLSAWIAAAPGRPTLRVATVAALVIANGLLLVQYQTFMRGARDLAPYPRGVVDLYVARFVVPFRLLRHWMGLP